MADTCLQRVIRSDGRAIDVLQRRAHLSYCFNGCCCGRTDRGYPPVPADAFKDEWLRRKLKKVVHLTKAGCLGPCALAPVYPEGTVYGGVDEAGIDWIVAEHLIGGRVVESLAYAPSRTRQRLRGSG